MGLHWHLNCYLKDHRISYADLEERLGLTVAHDLRGETPPIDLSLPVLADLCQALQCQPADLLSFTPDTPAETAERNLSGDLFYQSFLSFKQGQDAEG